MHDDRAATGSRQYLVAIERITFNPRKRCVLAAGFVDITGQRTHFPACSTQLSRYFTAYPAGGTQYQNLFHDRVPQWLMRPFCVQSRYR